MAASATLPSLKMQSAYYQIFTAYNMMDLASTKMSTHYFELYMDKASSLTLTYKLFAD